MPANAPTPWRRLSGCDSATALAGATLSGKESPFQINATSATTTADAPLGRARARRSPSDFASSEPPEGTSSAALSGDREQKWWWRWVPITQVTTREAHRDRRGRVAGARKRGLGTRVALGAYRGP